MGSGPRGRRGAILSLPDRDPSVKRESSGLAPHRKAEEPLLRNRAGLPRPRASKRRKYVSSHMFRSTELARSTDGGGRWVSGHGPSAFVMGEVGLVVE